MLTAGNDINLGAASTVAVNGQKGGEITVQAQSGTLLADGSLSARGASGTGGSVQLLGHQVGLVNAAQVDASGATGGGTVLVGGDYQGGNAAVQNAAASFVASDVQIKADATATGRRRQGHRLGGWHDPLLRQHQRRWRRGGWQRRLRRNLRQGDADHHRRMSAPRRPGGLAGTWLLDPNNITIQAAGSDTNVVGVSNLFSSADSAIVTTASIQNALNAGTSVAVTTGMLAVPTVRPATSRLRRPSRRRQASTPRLRSTPANNIVFNAGSNVSSSAGQLGVTLNAGGNINSAANINTNGGLLTFNAAGASSTQSGVVSGAGGLTKTGAGTLTLSGANTYTGATAVNAGTLNLQNNTATGTSTGGVTVASGAALELQGGITVGAETLIISGVGVGGNGALRNVSGNNTWGGTVTLAGNSEVQSDGGTLTLNAATAVTGANRTLTIDGAGNILVSGIIATSTTGGVLTKNGTGTLTLSGANTYAGATAVNAGTLNLQNNTATGTALGGVTVASGAALELQGGIVVGAEALSINGTGVGANGALRNISGNNTWGGTVTLAGNSEVQSDGGTLTLSAATSVVATTRALAFDGPGNTLVGGAVTGTTATLTKNGTGLLTLQGANTYAGATAVNAGTLALSGANGSSLNSAKILNFYIFNFFIIYFYYF